MVITLECNRWKLTRECFTITSPEQWNEFSGGKLRVSRSRRFVSSHLWYYQFVSCEFDYGTILGSIILVVNTFVCWLIIFDKDPRGKGYRKYLFSLQVVHSSLRDEAHGFQFFSTIADFALILYSPFVQANIRVIFADSIMAGYIGFVPAIVSDSERASCHFHLQTLFFALLAGIAISYFLCVYYRRNVGNFFSIAGRLENRF